MILEYSTNHKIPARMKLGTDELNVGDGTHVLKYTLIKQICESYSFREIIFHQNITFS